MTDEASPICRKCAGTVVLYAWHRLRNGKLAIRATCARCRKHIKYVPKTAANALRAGKMPEERQGRLF